MRGFLGTRAHNLLDDEVVGEQSGGRSYVFILDLHILYYLIYVVMVITSPSNYRGGYPFQDCTCARGILVPVWALAPNRVSCQMVGLRTQHIMTSSCQLNPHN